MRRDVFTADHQAFREVVRDFLAKEVVPHFPEWEKLGHVPRDVFAALGSLGLVGTAIPEEFGGGGQQAAHLADLHLRPRRNADERRKRKEIGRAHV